MYHAGNEMIKLNSEIRLVPVDNIVPYVRNARTHGDEQIAQIAGSMQEFGFTNPILLDGDNGVIAGHGRLIAARKLGLTEVPCINLGYLTKTQRQALVLADNKLAMNAGWDADMLGIELRELDLADFDMDVIGFNADELANLLLDPGEGLTDPDDIPAEPDEPISVLGDVWVLGKHRLVCGDSTDADVVAKALNGIEPHLMVTDPPYGVEYNADWRNKALRANGSPIGGKAIGKVENDDNADWREAYSLFPGDVCYVWHPAGALQNVFYRSLVESGFDVRMQIIWAKSQFPIGRGHYHVQHEPCWYAVRKKSGATGHWNGDRKQTTLWKIDKPRKSETGHSTQKPVECMRRPIENNSSPGQAVYEPFSGSGTTIIAAEQTGRACHAIELNPAYVDMAVIRWQNYTGKQAVHGVTGMPFGEMAEEVA